MNYFEMVGQNILHILNTQNMKNTELAVKLNISRQMVQKIINGQKVINVKEISCIAEALAISVDELLPVQAAAQRPASPKFMGRPGEPMEISFVEKTIQEYMKLEDCLYELS